MRLLLHQVEDVSTELAQAPHANSPLSGASPDAKRGHVEFRNVWLRYRAGLEYVLRGITMDIAAGSKVGIVGRTGAGKSSLIQALFRLSEYERSVPVTELKAGQVLNREETIGIRVDGVWIHELPLSALRKSMGIIPQDPTLFRCVSGVPRASAVLLCVPEMLEWSR